MDHYEYWSINANYSELKSYFVNWYVCVQELIKAARHDKMIQDVENEGTLLLICIGFPMTLERAFVLQKRATVLSASKNSQETVKMSSASEANSFLDRKRIQ